MRDFRTLKVWEKAHEFVLKIYPRTTRFPDYEKFGLTNQLRRAAASVPMNIAEGCGAGSDADFARFVQIAIRSCCEVEYQLILARDLKYISPEEETTLGTEIVEVRRMLIGFVQRLRDS